MFVTHQLTFRTDHFTFLQRYCTLAITMQESNIHRILYPFKCVCSTNIFKLNWHSELTTSHSRGGIIPQQLLR